MNMKTRYYMKRYFACVRANHGWEDFLADDFEFTNFTHPVKHAAGKQASLAGIGRFYAMVRGLEIKDIIVGEEKVCALTRYELEAPEGSMFESHIAEVFQIRSDQILSLGIYFDSAPYPKPPSSPKRTH